MSAFTPEEIDLWYSPNWCDHRWRITGCRDSTVWHVFYIIHTIWGYLATVLGLWIVYKKVYQGVWGKGLSIWDGWRPRAAESFLLGAVIHMFMRAVYSSILLGVKDPFGYGIFGGNALAEVLHDIPWIVLFDGIVMFTIGIIYATPRHRLSETTTRVRLPSPSTLTILLLTWTILPAVTLPLFAGLDGHGRDIKNVSFSRTFHYLHHFFWSAYCWGWAGVTGYYGYVLLTQLKESIKNVGEDGMESAVVKQAKDLSEFKRAIKSTGIIIAFLFVSLIASACVLLLYGLFRYQIGTHRAANIIFGMTWIFIFEVILTPIFVVMLWGIYKTKQEQLEKTRASTNNSSSGGQRTSGTVPPISGRKGSIMATLPISPTSPSNTKNSFFKGTISKGSA